MLVVVIPSPAHTDLDALKVGAERLIVGSFIENNNMTVIFMSWIEGD